MKIKIFHNTKERENCEQNSESIALNPIQEWGGGGGKKAPPTSFSPVTSTLT